MPTTCRAAIAVALLLMATSTARAQVGSTTDILTGTVRNPAGQPVANATVTATSVETQVVRTRRTDDRGRWVIVFPDGGGRYQVSVKSIGFEPMVQLVNRVLDEDQLVVNITLGGSPQRLDRVVVRAAPRQNDRQPSPGTTERAFTPDQLMRLPIEDQSDLTALAALAPGVVTFGGSDSTNSSFSVAGQRTDQNSITLDGLSFGSSSIPQDAVRRTTVTTNTWDVARGQFSGGQIASTTRGGTNVIQGSFTDAFRDPGLAWSVPDAGAFGQAYHQNTLSGGVGGPIIQNKLFAFAAFQVRDRTDPLQSLLAATPATLSRLGANPDSVTAFLSRVAADSVPFTLAGIPGDRPSDGDQVFVRLDANITDGQTLMLRYDARGNNADAIRVGSMGFPTGGGVQRQSGSGIMATLTSHFATDNGAIINEFRAYRSWADQGTDPYLVFPTGRVQLVSTIPPSGSSTSPTLAATTLQFGGNSSLPQASANRGLELSEEVSYIPAGSGHRLKLGALFNQSDFDQDVTTNRWGTYTYASLADFMAGQPSSYTRTLAPRIRTGGATSLGVYLGDTWRAAAGLQFTYGVRAEGSRYDGAPAPNPGIDSLFGIRTDRFPTETHISPRLGFSWAIGARNSNAAGGDGGGAGGRGAGGAGGGRGGAGGGGFGGFGQGPGGGQQPSTVLRGGIGEFRGLAPTQLFSAAQASNGLATGESQLVCTGTSVPPMDFADWLSGAAPIPSACASGGPVIPTNPLAAHPNVTVFDPTFEAPRSWRGALGVTHRIADRFALSLDVTWAVGVAQYGYRDINLVSTPAFTLPNEGNRPVFVPAATIVPATGTGSQANSRVHPEYGRVLLTSSDLHSDTRQVTAGFQAGTARGLNAQVSYTWTRSVDESSFPGSSGGQGVAGSTAGDPNVRSWATSDLQRTHQVVATVSYPVLSWLELSAVGRLASGSPFTPVVGGDINGDGARNDQAFVFDPATTSDTAVANGMRRVIASAPESVRDCLIRSLGKVAERNGCTNPWSGTFDVQLNLRPTWGGLDRRLTISLSTINLLAGLDRWAHGADNLAGWGATPRADPVLLTVHGFNSANNAYVYQVNERFGQSATASQAFRTPVQISLQARLTFGPDPVRDRLRQVFGAGRDTGATAFEDRFARLVPNPIDSILVLRDSLALTDAQATSLVAIRDSLNRANAPIGDSLRVRMQREGANPDPRTAFTELTPLLQRARVNATAALEQARAALSPEQWARIPDSIKRPPRGAGGGRGGQRPGTGAATAPSAPAAPKPPA